MRILVTGGAGFIGSHLCASLAADGHELVVLDDLSTGKREQLPQGVKLVTGDIAQEGVFDPLLDGIEACFHLAAIPSVERSYTDWLRTHLVNCMGTVNLFAAISRSKKPIPVIYASSAAAYGTSEALPLSEGGPSLPLSAYGADKLACEWQGRIAERNHNIPNIGLRFFNVYGPRQDPASPYSGVISIFANRILKKQSLIIHGDGEQSRDFIYVADIVHGLKLSLDALHTGKLRCGVFNLCTGKGTSVLELAHTLGDVMGSKPKLNYGPARPGDARYSYGNPTLASASLNFHAGTSLKDGLGHTLEWLKASA